MNQPATTAPNRAVWDELYARYMRDLNRRQVDLPPHVLRLCLFIASATVGADTPVPEVSLRYHEMGEGIGTTDGKSIAVALRGAFTRGLITRRHQPRDRRLSLRGGYYYAPTLPTEDAR